MDGSLKWAVDVKLPGMVHARNVKPPVAGATLVSIDESSVQGVPGFIKVVSKGNYVAVVCEREEQAIRAARQLKVNWQKPATAPFPTSDDLFTYMRARDAHRRARPPTVVGNPDAALTGAATVVEAEYDVPFQGHTVDRPGARAGRSVERSDDDLLERHEVVRPAQRRRRSSSSMPRDRVRVVWMEGPQALRPHGGRRCRLRGGVPGEGARPAGARAVDAARRDGVGHQGPGVTPCKMRGGLDAQGNLVALDYDARAADYNHLGYNEPDTVLIAQLTDQRKATPARGGAVHARPTCTPIPNRRMATHVVSPAAGVGNAASHRQPARSERPAGDVRRPSRSSTSWRRPPRPIRSSSA